jgi:hypothetical protein
VAITGKNVTNTHYRTQAFLLSGTGLATEWNAPATVEISLRRKFGGRD